MSNKDKSEFVFKNVVTCENPMEAEIYPATLREKEIPHRTEWKPGGKLSILVPEEWEAEAREAITKASQVFFGESGKDQENAEKAPKTTPSSPITEEEEEEEDLYPPFGRPSMFDQDGLPSPDEMKIRAIWPAWVLACLPGTGLGHLYAGKFQMWIYLVFMSLLGFLFFQFTKSYYSFLLTLFSWSVDLVFAAYHVKEHNRRAERARKRAELAEKSFMDSLEQS
jgi:hypothetical protein